MTEEAWLLGLCEGLWHSFDGSMIDTVSKFIPRKWRWVINNFEIVLAGRAQETLPLHLQYELYQLLFLHHHYLHHYYRTPNQFPPKITHFILLLIGFSLFAHKVIFNSIN